mmetsp:Transcript_15997/g.27256  ORF Transcript_15997/g.27256 Transcript_15997/m.27256 type:complete len:152 (+) Transcript_15997:719-1174(+)
MRRFRASTYQSTTVIEPDICTLPLKLDMRSKRLKRDAFLLPTKKRKVGDSNTRVGSNSRDDSSYYGPCDNGVDEGGDDDDRDDDYGKVPCWNMICIPLLEYTKRAYGTNYIETMCVQIHSNCQLKRVYFAEKEMKNDDELPQDFRLYYHPL